MVLYHVQVVTLNEASRSEESLKVSGVNSIAPQNLRDPSAVLSMTSRVVLDNT